MQSRSSAVITAAVTTLALSGLTSAATVTWTGTTDSNWDTTTGNWSGGVPNASLFVDGDAATFGAATNRTIAVAAPYNVGLVTFTSAINGNYAFSGGALTFTGGLTNSNTTASRSVTFGNNIVVSGSQTWAASSSNAVTTINGNLSSTAGTVLTLDSNQTNNGTRSTFRLAGNNSGFLGNITVGATADDDGIELSTPSAMIAGNINAGGNNNKSVTIGNSGTYTFGIGSGAGAINFRNGGSGGLYVVGGGDSTWDPGNGGSYNWANSGNNALTLGGNKTSTTDYSQIQFGNNTGTFTLSGADKVIRSGGGGNNANSMFLNLKFALADDGTARQFTAGNVVLNRAASGVVGAGAGADSRTTIAAGLVSVSNMNQLFDGNLRVDNNGMLVLNGVSWADFAADRTAGYSTSTTAENTWQLVAGGGIAARGSAITVSTSATDASTFDKSFVLGSTARTDANTYYANANVTIGINTTLTGARNVTVAANGRGIATATGVVNTISGSLSGAGALAVTNSQSDGAQTTTPGELVLSGANSWTGGIWAGSGFHQTQNINTGPGGMLIGRSYVRFDTDASLPTGNAGSPSFIATLDANNGANAGVLFTGGVTEKAYDLSTGQKLLFGSTGTTANTHTLGASEGDAKLRNSTVALNLGSGTGSQTLVLLSRDNSTFTLGDSAAGPVRFVPTVGSSVSSAPLTATTLSDTTGTRVLVKRGEGTVVLGNVSYTDVAETGNTASLFSWQIGRGTGGNSGASAYFDGAVRGLAPSDPAANDSNSLKNFFTSLRGGVYEINNSGGNSGTFNRTVSITASPSNISIGNLSGTTGIGGGGFAAYGGDVVVDLNTLSTRDTFTFGANNSGFVQANDSLLLGSNTANARVNFYDNLALNNAVREVRVIDNAASTTDLAELSGVLSGTGTSGLSKTGAGTLVLSNTNTYVGVTNVTAGTLRVNGSITGTGAVTVSANATLGGSGTLSGVTTVNGVVSPGNSIGTLTVANDVTWNSNNAWVFELGTSGEATLALADTTPSNNDRLNLTGAGSDFFKGTGTSFTFDFAGTGGNGWYKLVDWVGTTNFLYTDFVASNLPLGSTATFLVDNATSALYVNVVVPEPTSIALLGLAGLTLGRRRRAA